MTTLITVLLVLTLAMLGTLLAVVLRKPAEKPREAEPVVPLLVEFQKELASLKGAMKDQSLELSRQVQEQFRQNQSFLQETHRGYTQAVGTIQHRLGELQQATQSMVTIGRDIASLQDILRSPKLRGGLGELLLAELLRQILPEEHYSLQYSFQSGQKVDAIIRLGDGLIPVDAKFPLENFRRIQEAEGEDAQKAAKKVFLSDVKKHVDAIASKYILPAEGTFEFALMYIPAENVYYETILKDDNQTESLGQYALARKVVPVSPNSFYAYLQAIVRGLKGLRIEKSAQEILRSLGQLETDFSKCLEDFEKVGTHLSNAHSAYEKTGKRFEKIHGKLSAIEKHDNPPGMLPGLE